MRWAAATSAEKRARYLLAGGLAVSALASGGVQAPHARVNVVNPNHRVADQLTATCAPGRRRGGQGRLLHRQGHRLRSAHRPWPLHHHLKPDIDALKSALRAKLSYAANWKSGIFIKIVDASTLTVLTGVNAAPTDEPFYFLLP